MEYLDIRHIMDQLSIPSEKWEQVRRDEKKATSEAVEAAFQTLHACAPSSEDASPVNFAYPFTAGNAPHVRTQ